ncbi:MAG TPA: hypothetical protein ENJ06_06575 [Phycisphaeraceae bacterium]|nr:hypothetical protein [Phycisphaeraceae bacterium]
MKAGKQRTENREISRKRVVKVSPSGGKRKEPAAIILDAGEPNRRFTGWDLPNYDELRSWAPPRIEITRDSKVVGV